MTNHERGELVRLTNRWISGCATKSQILRCIDLERKSEHERHIKHTRIVSQVIN